MTTRKPGFQPGASGNPAGRPRGSRNRSTLALEAILDGDAEGILRKATELAKEGDVQAMRMCLADDTDDDLPEIVYRRKRKHAKAQAASVAKRKASNAPRRDDLARAAYYVLLLTMDDAEKHGEIERANRMRRRMLLLMRDAQFDRAASAVIFDDHADTVVQDVKAWVAIRRNAKRKEADAQALRSAAE